MRAGHGWTTAVVSALATAAVAAQEPGAQLPDVEFRVDVNYVEVDARVLDAAGGFVRDLTQDDFEILEDGVPRPIDRFSLVDIPLEERERPLFVSDPIEADTATNARAFDGRLYLIVLDDLHVAPLRTSLAKAAARDFIEHRLGANDHAAVVTTRGGSFAFQGFTTNRRILLDAVDRFVGQKLESATLMAANTPGVVDRDQGVDARFAPGSEPVKLQRSLDARAAIGTLRNAAEFLAGVRGRRKALIYISEGIDYDVYDALHDAQASDVAAASREAVAMATRANVAIYAIDPRGLTSLVDDNVELGGGLTTQAADVSGQGSLQREQTLAHDSLRELSDLTGGFAAVNVGDLDRVYERIVTENSSYYVLGYYATNERAEGRSRDIEVRVRRPGVQVFARDSYVEPRRGQRADTPASLEDLPLGLLEALRSPLPLAGLKLSATAAAFRGPDGKPSVAVVVELAGDNLGLLLEGERHAGQLDVAAWAVDVEGGRGAAEHRQVVLDLPADTYARLTERGLKVVLRLRVPPGRHQLRIAALAPDVAVRGSVFYDLVVPDFARETLAMSHVLLTSAVSSRVLSAQRDPELAELLPAAPTAVREFPVGDQLAVLAEIYDNDRRPHTVDVSSSILTTTGAPVFTTSNPRSSEEFGDDGVGTYTVVFAVPLVEFEPGLYVLRIEARSRVAGVPLVQRDVQFRVRR